MTCSPHCSVIHDFASPRAFKIFIHENNDRNRPMRLHKQPTATANFLSLRGLSVALAAIFIALIKAPNAANALDIAFLVFFTAVRVMKRVFLGILGPPPPKSPPLRSVDAVACSYISGAVPFLHPLNSRDASGQSRF